MNVPAAGVVALVTLAVPSVVGAEAHTGAKACGVTVKVADHAKYVVNQYVLDAMRYVPGTVTVKSGCDLTFEFATPDDNDPHSLSIDQEVRGPEDDRGDAERARCARRSRPNTSGPDRAGRAAQPDRALGRQRRQAGARRPRRQPQHLRVEVDKGAPPGHARVTVSRLGASRDDRSTTSAACTRGCRARSSSRRTADVDVVGREEELASLHAFVGGPRRRPPRSCSRARPGIGKSTLWLAGVEHARARGLRVLSSRPAEAERGLAHAGLGDLLRGRPRRRPAGAAAAEAARARGRAAARGRGRRRRRSARARRSRRASALQLLADRAAAAGRDRRRPVARRLVGERARVRAATARCEPACSCCSRGGRPTARSRRELEQALGAERVRAAARSGRSASARSIGSCATGSAGRSRARPCSASTSGRAEIRSSRWSWPAFSTRTSTRCSRSRFPRRSRSSCARGSPGSRRRPARRSRSPRRSGTPSESLLERAGVAPDALEPALAAHVIERDDGTIRFTHPLLSSVLYGDLGDGAAERSRADRARSSTTRSSAPVTSRSRRTRRTPRSRPSLDERREAGGRSWRVGRRGRARRAGAPADAAAARRRASSSRARCSSCASRRRRVDARPDDRRRAAGRDGDRLVARRGARSSSPSSRASTVPSRCSRRRSREAASRPALQSVIHCRLAWATRFRKGYVQALEHARGVELADELDDDVLRDAGAGRARDPRLVRRRRGGRPPCPRGRTTSRPRSAASSWCRRRPSPS